MSKSRYAFWLSPFLFFATLLVFLAGLSEAQAVKTTPQEEKIRSVIQQQLDAFNREDYDAAYLFASRHIQTKFSKREFEQMVKGGYPQIARSKRAVFDTISFPEENRAMATVMITGLDRISITASYRMVWEDGKWKIDGVTMLEERMPVSYEPA